MALTRTQLADPNCLVTDSDYEAIESAIMETSRGRWFLSEYARRNRTADTELLLSAINSLKEMLDSHKRNASPYLVSTSVSSALPTNQKEVHGRPIRMLQAISNGNDKDAEPTADGTAVAAQTDNANDVNAQRSRFLSDDTADSKFKF